MSVGIEHHNALVAEYGPFAAPPARQRKRWAHRPSEGVLLRAAQREVESLRARITDLERQMAWSSAPEFLAETNQVQAFLVWEARRDMNLHPDVLASYERAVALIGSAGEQPAPSGR